MTEVLIVLALLATVLGFMAWDRYGSPSVAKRDSTRGVVPGSALRWQVPVLAALVCGVIAAAEAWAWAHGQAPLWTSTRPGWRFLHELLGPCVNLVFATGLAAMLLVYGWHRRRLLKSNRAWP